MSACAHPEGPGHDCEYVDRRDSLVPVAAAMADAEVPEHHNPEGSRRWDAAFHRAMSRLTADPFVAMAIN